MDDVADVDLAHAGDPVDRRGEPGIAELYIGCFDERLVGLDGALQLRHLRGLGIDQLRVAQPFSLPAGYSGRDWPGHS